MTLPALIIWFILLHCHRNIFTHEPLPPVETRLRSCTLRGNVPNIYDMAGFLLQCWGTTFSNSTVLLQFKVYLQMHDGTCFYFKHQWISLLPLVSAWAGPCSHWSPFGRFCIVALLTTSSVFFLQVTWRTWGRASEQTPNQTGSQVFAE